MKKQHCRQGFALVTVLIITTISMTLISTLFLVLNRTTNISAQEKNYLTELEAAKGASEFIMAALRNESLTCSSGAACSPDGSIDLHGGICTALGRPGCNGLSAQYLSEASLSPGSGLPDVTLVGVAVTAIRPGGREKAVVEFVYKIY